MAETTPAREAADPLDALKDYWHQKGYCLGATSDGKLLAFFITDEKPADHLVEAGTPGELADGLRADYERRGRP